MNRVSFLVLQQQTTVPLHQLRPLQTPQPKQTAFVSERFPLYPLVIHIYLQNPPFNKFSISFESFYQPNALTMYASQNSIDYFKCYSCNSFESNEQHYIHIFKKIHYQQYLRLVFDSPISSKQNPCQQLRIRGIQFSNVTFYKARYVCCLQAKLTHHPILFRLMELQEYKMLLLRETNRKLSEKYQQNLQDLINKVASKAIDRYYPDTSLMKKCQQQIKRIQTQPVLNRFPLQQPDPLQTKKDISKLQKQLKQFAIDRLVRIKPDIAHYFQKYHNQQIRDIYLRLLSSNQVEDHNKALTTFWGEVKKVSLIDIQTHQAILMFFNFFLQQMGCQLKSSAVKVLILCSKLHTVQPQRLQLDRYYQRIMYNIVKLIHLKEDQDLYDVSLRYIYIIYDRISNYLFLKQLLNAFRSHTLHEQIQKLQILQKITFRGVQVVDRAEIVQFLITILESNKITLTVKNRAYNVAAYLASLFGKQNIMKDFQALNSMILMTMQKNIDTKLNKFQQGFPSKIEDQFHCQFCGTADNTLKDDNLYDLHLAKQCRFITTCNYCHQNIQIPELHKHYMEQCTHKHEFKHCQQCFQVIKIADEQTHKQKCERKLQTKCPLCQVKVDSKLKLKEHLLIDGCPNNPR